MMNRKINNFKLYYLGKSYELETRMNQKNIVELADKFYVASSNAPAVKRYLTGWFRQQARKVIQQRVLLLSKMAGLHFNTMSITDAETRWGSCSSQRNLNFNWKLVMAPMEVIDYVAAHELAHLVEMNHSRQFWETVRKMFPLYRQYRTWLRRNGDTLNI